MSTAKKLARALSISNKEHATGGVDGGAGGGGRGREGDDGKGHSEDFLSVILKARELGRVDARTVWGYKVVDD